MRERDDRDDRRPRFPGNRDERDDRRSRAPRDRNDRDDRRPRSPRDRDDRQRRPRPEGDRSRDRDNDAYRQQASSPRSIAARILNRMEGNPRPIDELVREEAGTVPPALKRKAKALTASVLRRKSTIDQIIKCFADQRLQDIERHTLTCLRLGMAEIFFLPSEKPAAVEVIVDAIVDLAGTFRYRRRRSFVNGVFRECLRQMTFSDDPADKPAPDATPRDTFVTAAGRTAIFQIPIVSDPEEKPSTWLAQYAGISRWLARRWVARMGLKAAAVRAYHLNAPPGIGLRANLQNTKPKDLIAELEEAGIPTDQPFGKDAPEALRVLKPRVVTATDAFAEGRYYIQDLATTLVGRFAKLKKRPQMRILDAAAAPGGKITHVYELLDGKGTFVAIDPSPTRLRQIRENMKRLQHPDIEVEAVPLQKYADRDVEPFDLVILDAPCSNTGVLNRRVEARQRLDQTQLISLLKVQDELLDAAAKLVKPGGQLLYSTCSLEEEENSENVRAFLERHTDFTLDDESVTEPLEHAHDGGYRARLLRNK